VLTNQSSGNAVMLFHRDAAGTIRFAGSFPSGGKGAGTGADPLGSQGPVALSCDHRLLFAVNAGSNSISVFAVSGDSLLLLQTVSSGGTRPASLTVRDGLLYVVNAGGTPNISGFRVQPATNHLMPLAGSTQNLPGGAAAAPAQVSFNRDATVLVVTEKGTNLVDTFVLSDDGVAQAGVSFPSSGATPFGFAFAHGDIAIVSEAAGGPSGTSAVSSYEVDQDGSLEVVTPSLGDTQKAACWIVVPENGRFAYTANTASGTISSYTVSDDGHLTLLDATAASGKVPVDMALTNNSRFLYVRDAGSGTIRGFLIRSDGSLMAVTSAGGLPSGATGLAAR
jgi:6-phosphogluconolactonase (cycloisomerase 2 family)